MLKLLHEFVTLLEGHGLNLRLIALAVQQELLEKDYTDVEISNASQADHHLLAGSSVDIATVKVTATGLKLTAIAAVSGLVLEVILDHLTDVNDLIVLVKFKGGNGRWVTPPELGMLARKIGVQNRYDIDKVVVPLILERVEGAIAGIGKPEDEFAASLARLIAHNTTLICKNVLVKHSQSITIEYDQAPASNDKTKYTLKLEHDVRGIGKAVLLKNGTNQVSLGDYKVPGPNELTAEVKKLVNAVKAHLDHDVHAA